MRAQLLRTAVLVGSFLGAGCHGEATPSSSAGTEPARATTAPSAAVTAAAKEAPLTTARRLALAKPGGSGPLDVEIERLQKAADVPAQAPLPASDAWVLLGRAWVRKARESSDPGFYLNAKASADVALDVAPSNRAAENLVGLVLLNQHRFDDARDLAEQILRKSPEDRMALGTLSDAFLEVGRYDEARAAAQRMMDQKPNLPSYVRASYLEWLRGDGKAALESIRAAIDAGRDPRDPEPRCWAMVQAAMIFWHRGDYAGADAGFNTALGECRDYPPALVGRGRAAMAKDEHARAAEAAGDAKGAEEAWAQAVKQGKATDPRTLALFYATKDREHEEAVRLAREEMKVRQDIYTLEALAWALHRAGKTAEAKAAAERSIAHGTRDARLLYHAGAIKIAAGEKAAGEKLVKDALALSPKFDWTGAAEAAKLVER